MDSKIIKFLDKVNKYAQYFVALLMTGSFFSIFEKMFSSKENTWEIFVLITLPLVIGSMLSKDEYAKSSTNFLASSLYLIFGFLCMFIQNDFMIILGIIVMNLGAFFFSLGVFRLIIKVSSKMLEK